LKKIPRTFQPFLAILNIGYRAKNCAKEAKTLKRSLALLFVCAFLISDLTACGCSASPQNDAPQSGNATQNSGDMQSGSGTQNGNGTQNDSAVIGGDTGTDTGVTPDHTLPDGAQGSLEQGANDIRDGIDNAVDDITGNDNSSGGVSYDQMLRNGRVKNGALANDGTASGMK